MQEEYEIYGGFASVYDLFMDNIPYDEWFQYVVELFKKRNIHEGLVVELGCGTGEMTRRLADAGYQMIGVDLSEDMLAVAQEKCGEEVLLLHQDMRELELYGSVTAMLCVCDGMNYICQETELKQVFERVFRFLEPDGLFLFDMKTEYFYREVLGNRTITDNRENASYIWENAYHEDEQLNEYLLTVYELADDERDLFVRTDELHHQRAYNLDSVKKLLEHAGFSEIDVYEALTQKEPDKKSERVYFVAQKSNKIKQ